MTPQSKYNHDWADLVTLTELAKRHDVTPKTILEWRKMERGCPEKVRGKESLSAWAAWFAANPDAGFCQSKPTKTKDQLQCEKLAIEIQRAKIELEVAEGKLVRADEARESMTRVTSAARAMFLKLAADLPPQLEGLNAGQMQKKIRLAVIEVLTTLSDETATIYQKGEK